MLLFTKPIYNKHSIHSTEQTEVRMATPKATKTQSWQWMLHYSESLALEHRWHIITLRPNSALFSEQFPVFHRITLPSSRSSSEGGLLNLQTKALWSFNLTYTAHPVTQSHIAGDRIFCIIFISDLEHTNKEITSTMEFTTCVQNHKHVLSNTEGRGNGKSQWHSYCSKTQKEGQSQFSLLLQFISYPWQIEWETCVYIRITRFGTTRTKWCDACKIPSPVHHTTL